MIRVGALVFLKRVAMCAAAGIPLAGSLQLVRVFLASTTTVTSSTETSRLSSGSVPVLSVHFVSVREKDINKQKG